MDTKRFAMIMGIVFLAVGVLGFVPGINRSVANDPNLTLHGPGHGYILGLFHVNVLHNVVHLLFGVMGIVLSRRLDSAIMYARIVAVAYGLLTIMGLVSAANMNYTFGLVPIHGNNVWLHALIAIAATYYGFVKTTAGTDAAVTDATRPAV